MGYRERTVRVIFLSAIFIFPSMALIVRVCVHGSIPAVPIGITNRSQAVAFCIEVPSIDTDISRVSVVISTLNRRLKLSPAKRLILVSEFLGFIVVMVGFFDIHSGFVPASPIMSVLDSV